MASSVLHLFAIAILFTEVSAKSRGGGKSWSKSSKGTLAGGGEGNFHWFLIGVAVTFALFLAIRWAVKRFNKTREHVDKGLTQFDSPASPRRISWDRHDQITGWMEPQREQLSPTAGDGQGATCYDIQPFVAQESPNFGMAEV